MYSFIRFKFTIRVFWKCNLTAINIMCDLFFEKESSCARATIREKIGNNEIMMASQKDISQTIRKKKFSWFVHPCCTCTGNDKSDLSDWLMTSQEHMKNTKLTLFVGFWWFENRVLERVFRCQESNFIDNKDHLTNPYSLYIFI